MSATYVSLRACQNKLKALESFENLHLRRLLVSKNRYDGTEAVISFLAFSISLFAGSITFEKQVTMVSLDFFVTSLTMLIELSSWWAEIVTVHLISIVYKTCFCLTLNKGHGLIWPI